MWQSFPLMAIGLAIYVALSLLLSGQAQPWYLTEVASMQMPSGARWSVSAGDVFLLCALVLLFIEIVRSPRIGPEPLLNHAFSVVVFVVGLLLFLMRADCANSTFFSFIALTTFDFLAGFIISILAARRQVEKHGVLERL